MVIVFCTRYLLCSLDFLANYETSLEREGSIILTSPSTRPDETIQRLRDLVFKMAHLVTLLNPLQHSLSKAVDAWTQFRKGDMKYFEDNLTPDMARSMTDALQALDGVYSRMHMRREELGNLIVRLKHNNVSSRAAAHPIVS